MLLTMHIPPDDCTNLRIVSLGAVGNGILSDDKIPTERRSPTCSSLLPILAGGELFVSYGDLQFGPWLAFTDLG